MSIGTTYSFKDLVGVLTNLVFGVTIPIAGGNVGVGSITIVMATERTAHDTAADGVVMPSYVAGRSGTVTIECQQTSTLHHALLSLYNQVESAANNDDVSSWAAGNLSFRTILDGATHICQGVSFGKLGDKPYHAQGQRVQWPLMACDIQNS